LENVSMSLLPFDAKLTFPESSGLTSLSACLHFWAYISSST
jgi:hypothetical protein